MGWETRNGKGAYFTRSERVNGRVTRVYFAKENAEELASLFELDKECRRLEREAVKAQQREAETVDRILERFSADVDKQVYDALTAAGYHRHARGSWRKSRKGKDNNEQGILSKEE